jgi:putative glutamine amidotransferase
MPIPVIAVPACIKLIDGNPFHAVQEKYLTALRDAADATPLPVPALGWRDQAHLDGLLDSVDGVMLTGSPSNVEPHHYDGGAKHGDQTHDPARDATTLPLIRRAVERGVPLLAICRGIQELNVALGGSLHQKVQDVAGKMDHRSKRGRPLDERYAPSHPVRLEQGGCLQVLLGARDITVNSLHAQGIDRLAPGLRVEATAPDGVIEAVWVEKARAFALGVQWHPEYRATENPISMAIFKAFGDAARQRAASRA